MFPVNVLQKYLFIFIRLRIPNFAPQDVKPGDVMQKKNMWEIIGDSSGKSDPRVKVDSDRMCFDYMSQTLVSKEPIFFQIFTFLL